MMNYLNLIFKYFAHFLVVFQFDIFQLAALQ